MRTAFIFVWIMFAVPAQAECQRVAGGMLRCTTVAAIPATSSTANTPLTPADMARVDRLWDHLRGLEADYRARHDLTVRRGS